MSWAAIGGSVLAAGVSVGGSALLGGMSGGSSGSSGSTVATSDATMQKYLGMMKRLGSTTIQDIDKIANSIQQQIADLGNNYLTGASQQEANAVNRVNAAATTLRAMAAGNNQAMATDIYAALNDLMAANEVLNLGNRADTMRELQGYQQQIASIDRQAKEESGVSLDKFENTSLALGDRFLDAAGRAQNQYRADTSVDPANLAKFTQAADFLSKAAQQTRLDLIANADPLRQQMEANVDLITEANLAGKIDATTAFNLARTGAFRALGGGYGAGSDAGRGMTARDFGLQALDLQKQGFSMFGAERDRRFDQKVAGLQVDSTGLIKDNDARSLAMFDASNRVAESDRNQRQGVADARLNEELGLNLQFYGKNRGSADGVLNANLTNLNSIYGNRRDDQGTRLNTRNAVTDQIYKTNMANEGNIFTASNNLAGSLYDGNMSALGKYYDTSANAALWAGGQSINARANNFTQLAGGLGSQAQVAIGAQQQDALNAQNAANTQAALWGSGINSAMALGGDIFGTLYKRPTTSNPANTGFFSASQADAAFGQ